MELVDCRKPFASALDDVKEHIFLRFLQQYYSQILGLQVLVNPYASQPTVSHEVRLYSGNNSHPGWIISFQNITTDAEKSASILSFGCRCVIGHINMSPAALEQCVTDIFANQNLENIQRIQRHGSYQKTGTVPKSITASSKDLKIGVPLALDQLFMRGNNGKTNTYV